ncbi:tryptophan halogenase family protein [Niveispirillum fermenti]|uniref:tryptophan halogenase family protein n=1 Tax=Niveispirillum fermenti TaxID=1233113 RepID=UPI003A8C7107
MRKPIRTIVIVGGGTAGWMSAAALARVAGKTHRLHLVESEEIGTVGVGEATIPPLVTFNRVLGINEDDFLRETQGTIKLGIEFKDWWRRGHRYMHAFGAIGRPLGLTPFHQFWLRARALGLDGDWEQYVPNTVAARALRYGRQQRPRTPLEPLTHAFHFDAGLYAALLRRHATAQGVKRTEGRIRRTVLNAFDGHVEAVEMEDGSRVAGDLFIDCSGFRGLLIEQALGTGFEDWSHWLPCDRAWAVPCANGGDFTPYTRSTAQGAGWQWRIPLQHRTGNGHVYASRYMGDDEAASILMGNLDGEGLAEPRLLRFTAGRRRQMWNRNVVAIGLAGGFLEPLESTSIHLVQSAISRLLTMLPNEGIDAEEVADFNEKSRLEYERIRDFIILHYKATERDDTPFWRDCRHMAVPDELARRMRHFQAHGRVSRLYDELFLEVSWVQVFLGQGVLPRGYNPLADQLTEKELVAFLAEVRAMIGHELSALPTHADFIAGIAGAVF